MVTDIEWKFDFFKLQSIHSLERISWKAALGIQKSTSGSSGVYFVELPEGAVVVKGSSSIGGEMFCSMLGQELGLPAPQCRILRRDSEEGRCMYESLVELDDLQPIYRTARQGLFREFLLLEEYCGPNVKSLKQIAEDEMSQTLERYGVNVMSDLGRICGFDLLVRNTDRIPLIIQNHGNPNNILVSPNSGRVYAIDNVSASLDIHSSREHALNYVSQVSKFLRELTGNPEEVHHSSMRLRDMLMDWVGISIEKDKLIAFQAGILEIILKVDGISLNDLAEFHKCVRDISGKNSESQVIGLDSIRLPFLEIMLTVFQKRGHVDVDSLFPSI